MKITILLLTVLICVRAFSQNDTTKKLTFSAYGELYYSYDFSKPFNHTKPFFLNNHKEHNEVNANLLLVKANYLDKTYRANLGLMAGNYTQYNFNDQPGWSKYIYEANIGIKLSKKDNLWLDAGIFPSHIGFESVIGADCWTLTRSLLAENSPYYEAGVKVGLTSKDEKLNLAVLYLNGWQKISKPNYIQKPSFGTQINYKFAKNLTFNYSTFLGSDAADNLKVFRHFHNTYIQYEPNKKFGIIAGFDIGVDKEKNNKKFIWYSPVVIVKKGLNEKTNIAFRGEYYHDPNSVIIWLYTPNGFKTFGASTNLDYDLNNKIKLRFEGKLYNSKDKIFNNKRNNYCLTTSLCMRL